MRCAHFSLASQGQNDELQPNSNRSVSFLLKKISKDFSKNPSIKSTGTLPILHREYIEEKTSKAIKKIEEQVQEFNLVDKQCMVDKKRAKKTYKELENKISFVQGVEKNNNKVSKKINQTLQEKIQQAQKEAKKRFEKEEMELEDMHICNRNYKGIENLLQYTKLCATQLKEAKEELQETYEKRVDLEAKNVKQILDDPDTIPEKTKSLCKLHQYTQYLSHFNQEKKTTKKINSLVKKISREKSIFNEVSKELENIRGELDSVAHNIIQSYPAFKKLKTSSLRAKMQSRKIEHILQDIKAKICNRKGKKKEAELNKKYLWEQFNKINDRYEKWIKKYRFSKKKKENIKWLANDLLSYTGVVRKKMSKKWTSRMDELGLDAIADLFAIWTLITIKDDEDNPNELEDDNSICKPHSAQIVAIIRMLGLDCPKKKNLENHLECILTGNGKSITLGILSALLAVFGFDVSCACYSAYLSQRDYNDFKEVFEAVGASEYIYYGTLNEVCERQINEKIHIREVVEAILLKQRNKLASLLKNKGKGGKRTKIIIFDEVDVILDTKVFGKLYSPLLELRHPAFTKLANDIWAHRNDPLTFNKITTIPAYQTCASALAWGGTLLKEAVLAMLQDLKTYAKRSYVVQHDCIGYVEFDGVNTKARHGYETLWHYYDAWEKGKWTDKKILEKNVYMNICCGSFSYAEIPMTFAYMLGVSGTVDTMTPKQWEIIVDKYHVKHVTYIPSLFSETKLVFPEKSTGITINEEKDYYVELIHRIKDELSRNGLKRSVLVFFEEKNKLFEFHEKSGIQEVVPEHLLNILTEETELQDKQPLIFRATTPGTVTFLSRIYGRGTNFTCTVEEVRKAGGVHVCQTFIAENASEATQIKGRTNRQGEPGSYSLDLKKKDLEWLNFKDTDYTNMDSHRSYYRELTERRDKIYEQKYNDYVKSVDYAVKEHKKSMDFFDQLLLYAKESCASSPKKTKLEEALKHIGEFLLENNRGPAPTTRCRTVILMDATGSMYALLEQAKARVREMFSLMQETLEKEKKDVHSFLIEFAAYRNYNAPRGELLLNSGFQSNPTYLESFMKSVSSDFGLGEEAVEVGFQYVNQISEQVHQIILIGDAPPNSPQQALCRRNDYKQYQHGKDRPFLAIPTDYEKELDKLKNKGIKVHTVYLNHWAKVAFEKIAQETGGNCIELNVSSPNSSDQLVRLISENVLEIIGGKELVKAFKKYNKCLYQS